MKKITAIAIAVLLAALMAVIFTACNGNKDKGETSSTTAEQGVVETENNGGDSSNAGNSESSANGDAVFDYSDFFTEENKNDDDTASNDKPQSQKQDTTKKPSGSSSSKSDTTKPNTTKPGTTKTDNTTQGSNSSGGIQIMPADRDEGWF